MCGIAGFVGARPREEAALRACLRRMHHRGPDGSGIRSWITPAGRWVQLLHSRLSIIDLDERANQPFSRSTKSISFNGELYNYVELRADLRRTGHVFTT